MRMMLGMEVAMVLVAAGAMAVLAASRLTPARAVVRVRSRR
jgi:hypothetical protein